MNDKTISIAIINYPGALKSAVFGFEEIFQLTNRLCGENQNKLRFNTEIVSSNSLPCSPDNNGERHLQKMFKAIIIPPGIDSKFYEAQNKKIISWLQQRHSEGTIMCSVCAGIFILAKTGLLTGRIITTHWGIASMFHDSYPDVLIDTDKILINDGDIITAGGLMAWLDLAIELVAQFAGNKIMLQLAKQMVVDSGYREQRYYKCFIPKLDHNDKAILNTQHYIQKNFHTAISVLHLAEISCLSERMFLRRFSKVTNMKPTQYIQTLRVQKACELIETTDHTFSTISHKVGYEDLSAFRKIFSRITGLTPRDFKKRFAIGQN